VLLGLELRADRTAPEPARMRHITLVPGRGARAVPVRRRDLGSRAASSEALAVS